MKFTDKVRWWFTGEISEVIVEEYEDTGDAIMYPLLGSLMTITMLFGASEMVSQAPQQLSIYSITGAAAGLFGAGCGLYTFISIGATVQYARKWTQNVREPKEVRN